MTIQANAYRGDRQTAAPRAVARAAIPIPSEYAAFRRYRAEFCRENPYWIRWPANDATPARAKPVERADGPIAKALWCVDHAAMSLMSGTVLALWPFAVCLLIGLI
jgi:hypothetical protein